MKPNKMDFPQRVTNSGLWKIIRGSKGYVHALDEIRKAALALGEQVQRILPGYTDHSVKHMDSLWAVTDQVLTVEEIQKINPSEAFVLGSCFYVHDLGMARAATAEGLADVKCSESYRAAFQRLVRKFRVSQPQAEILAVRMATRDLHAQKAQVIVSEPLPGIDRFLIEDTDLRQRWAHFIGRVAASHHWNLDQVHRDLGARNAVPGADGESIDLGYLACVLRIADYAHINRERAPTLERALRSGIDSEGAIHWDAQANITGPIRTHDSLVYGCTEPIEKVDAWWLFYDLAFGLDAEIRSVREYLRGRAVSTSRFSLQGVTGIEQPQTFANFIEIAGDTAPIDIRVQPHSMERVVELLGGPHLYGPDALAPIRELIQNARDAIELLNALERANGVILTPGLISISIEKVDDGHVLRVHDNGVGMTRNVVTRHLIGVGSDFWSSSEFFRDFGKAESVGFRPIGKFGVGFLSVFMLGNSIEVTTESRGGKRINLRLRGLGRRGELRETSGTGQVGTEVRVSLKPKAVNMLGHLAALVRARAPMLRIPISVQPHNGDADRIEPGWWKDVSDEALLEFVRDWRAIAYRGGRDSTPVHTRYTPSLRVDGKFTLAGWPGGKPRIVDDQTRVHSGGGEKTFGVVRCAQGIAVDVEPIIDVSGLAKCGELALTVSRDSTTAWHGPRQEYDSELGDRLVASLTPRVVAKLDELKSYGLIPARLGFLRSLAQVYGTKVLTDTRLPWIPVIEPPGNLIHHSKSEFIELLRKQKRVVLACGVGPGSAYGSAASRIPQVELGNMMLVAIPIEEVDVDYSVKRRLESAEANPLVGALHQVIERSGTSIGNLVLISLLISLVCEAWNVSEEDVRENRWSLDYQDDVLWGDLARSD